MYSESLLYTDLIYEVAKINMDEPIWMYTDTEFAGICFALDHPAGRIQVSQPVSDPILGRNKVRLFSITFIYILEVHN